ncbi:uncharacterized protein O3C94_021632 [Discoglossus pictus]
MRSLVCLVLLSLAVADAQYLGEVGRAVKDAEEFVKDAGEFVIDALQGSWDMGRAYQDMREANYVGADKYFHARGNYDAAQRGPGGSWAAEVLSDVREHWQSSVSGRGDEDTRADQEANAWGRNGGDPNRYRPNGLYKPLCKNCILFISEGKKEQKPAMRSLVCLVLLSLAVADAQYLGEVGRAVKDAEEFVKDAGEFVIDALQGSWDMGRAYKDMREANYVGADKYFHARGNYDAAKRGPGGSWAAEVLSDVREHWQSSVSGRGDEDTRADQEANAWGRNGGDPNHYRPNGLPNIY